MAVPLGGFYGRRRFTKGGQITISAWVDFETRGANSRRKRRLGGGLVHLPIASQDGFAHISEYTSAVLTLKFESSRGGLLAQSTGVVEVMDGLLVSEK